MGWKRQIMYFYFHYNRVFLPGLLGQKDFKDEHQTTGIPNELQHRNDMIVDDKKSLDDPKDIISFGSNGN